MHLPADGVCRNRVGALNGAAALPRDPDPFQELGIASQIAACYAIAEEIGPTAVACGTIVRRPHRGAVFPGRGVMGRLRRNCWTVEPRESAMGKAAGHRRTIRARRCYCGVAGSG